jgi:hypothetical protein
MLQADMYRCIMERKRCGTTRRSTAAMLDQTRAALKKGTGTTPSNEDIWKSIRHRDFSRAQRTFKWKVMHGAYKIGEYWNKISNYKERVTCPICRVEESIEHILLACDVPARKAIKKAEKELWRTCTNEPFPNDNIRTRVGSALLSLKAGKDTAGLERFWRIVQLETDQIIWTIQCEARIARGDHPEERHSEDEALNRWQSAIERRLNIE